MKNLLKLIFLLIAQISFAQDFIEIKSEIFEGVIIVAENNYHKKIEGLKLFTPTEKEIIGLEKVITEIQNKKNTQASRGIYSNIEFNKYIRQYEGFYLGGEAREKVILVKFFPKEIVEKSKLKWKSEVLYPRNVENSISMNFIFDRQEFYELLRSDE